MATLGIKINSIFVAFFYSSFIFIHPALNTKLFSRSHGKRLEEEVKIEITTFVPLLDDELACYHVSKWLYCFVDKGS